MAFVLQMELLSQPQVFFWRIFFMCSPTCEAHIDACLSHQIICKKGNRKRTKSDHGGHITLLFYSPNFVSSIMLHKHFHPPYTWYLNAVIKTFIWWATLWVEILQKLTNQVSVNAVLGTCMCHLWVFMECPRPPLYQ